MLTFKHPAVAKDRLARLIVEHVVDGELIDAVLDDSHDHDWSGR